MITATSGVPHDQFSRRIEHEQVESLLYDVRNIDSQALGDMMVESGKHSDYLKQFELFRRCLAH